MSWRKNRGDENHKKRSVIIEQKSFFKGREKNKEHRIDCKKIRNKLCPEKQDKRNVGQICDNNTPCADHEFRLKSFYRIQHGNDNRQDG